MSSDKRKQQLREQAGSTIDVAALRAARSVHVPGQTPEQTKLVAQGIAKGIALYRKQQNEKERERDRQRKRALKQRERERGLVDESQDSAPFRVDGGYTGAPAIILWGAGVVFAGAAVLHIVRVMRNLSIVVEGWAIPASWSLLGGFLAAVAAGACFWGDGGCESRHPNRPVPLGKTWVTRVA